VTGLHTHDDRWVGDHPPTAVHRREYAPMLVRAVLLGARWPWRAVCRALRFERYSHERVLVGQPGHCVDAGGVQPCQGARSGQHGQQQPHAVSQCLSAAVWVNTQYMYTVVPFKLGGLQAAVPWTVDSVPKGELERITRELSSDLTVSITKSVYTPPPPHSLQPHQPEFLPVRCGLRAQCVPHREGCAHIVHMDARTHL
jgi:hypothetical protein